MASNGTSLQALAFRRRFVLGCVVLVLVALAAVPMFRILSIGGWSILKVIFFALFLILFSQVAFSSVVAALGWWVLRHGPDPLQMTAPAGIDDIPLELPATAIVMPIHNEEVNRVFQGLRTMVQSLHDTGRGAGFDFFVLSDTSDPNCWISEEKAWFELCKQFQGFGRIFYRRRSVHLHHKSGNIADFCRRWGASYRYMIVLDADSVMTGASFVRLVHLMEQHPRAGIIQTTTQPIFGQSLFQRMEQFAAFVYRPIFTAGACFWQLADSTFWGHNAIIRLKPFMSYCAMPELPELGPLGRQIMSHDTIETALMRRGGYDVWQIRNPEGSYEEGPPNLLESLKRDRRWCHGNMQHVWFLLERGIKTVSRFNILIGILGYLNSPLWFLSLVIGVLIARRDALAHVAAPHSILLSSILYSGVMVLLFLPKILGTLAVLRSPEKIKICRSRSRLIAGVLIEALYSMLMAPILMLFYTRFVIASCCGMKASWGPQTRSDEKGPPITVWIRTHWFHTVFALWAAFWIGRNVPAIFWWMLPVLAGPILAISLSRLTASCVLGTRVHSRGWLNTPQEIHPPVELQRMDEPFIPPRQLFFRAKEYAGDYGLLQAVLDPYINAIHVSFLRQRMETRARTRVYMNLLADRLLLDGPFTLSPSEKRTLLRDADSMLAMHQKLWNSPPSHLHEWWQAAFRHYVETSALTTRRTISV